MENILEERPTLAAWLAEYDAISDDLVEQLRSLGVCFAERDAASRELQAARERLRDKGAVFRNAGASVVTGALSSACVACTGGTGSRTFTLSTVCNRNCYFCFNANQLDYQQTRSLKAGWRDELEAFLSQGDVTHVALTGGEPLLHPEETVEFFERVKTAFPQAHARLYTAGDFLDDALLGKLQAAGLDELRLSVKLDVLDSLEESRQTTEEALRRVRLAKRFVPDVMVEMPVIPGTGDAMRTLLRGLDEAGAFGINLLEFGFPMGNWPEFERRGFKVANPPFSVPYNYEYAAGLPIAGSELLCLELLEFAIEQGFSLGVHYCSLENKHRDQILQQNRTATPDPDLWELDQQDFFYKAAKVFDIDADAVARKLAAARVPFVRDEEDGSVSFALRHIDLVKDLPVMVAVSSNVIEGVGEHATMRELALKLLCE